MSAAQAAAAERVLLAPPASAAAPAAKSATRSVAAPKGAIETAAGSFARLRAVAAQKGKVRVIAGFRVPFAAEALLSDAERSQQQKEIAAVADRLRKKYAGTAKLAANIGTFASIPFATLTLNQSQLGQLLTDPDVLTVTEDMSTTTQLTYSVPQIGAPEAWKLGATGKGQTVAVIDKGAETDHPFLRDPVTGQSKVVFEGSCISGICRFGKGTAKVGYDAHGTSVAGIIAGQRPESAPGKSDGLTGVAPDARLMVFGTSTGGDVLRALDAVYQQRNAYKIAAINISLAFTRSTPDGNVPVILEPAACQYYNTSMTAMVANLKAAGIATVVSAGNHGEKRFGPGSTDKLAYPACLPDVVSVGAVFASRRSGPYTFDAASECGSPQYIKTDEVICYSDASPGLSVLAPGFPIETSSIGGQYIYGSSGTSAAAPHVAGAIADLKSAVPTATVADIVDALRLTGKPVKDYRTGRITPRIDVAQALAYLKGGAKAVVAYTSAGTGSGTVSFAPVGSRESCAEDCSVFFATGANVTITPRPDPGMEFLGWESATGECQAKAPTCSFTASKRTTQITAKFGRISGWSNYMLSFYRTGLGWGTISATANGKPLDCRTAFCNWTLPAGTMVTASVWLGDNTIFTGWTGPCSGTAPTCSFTLSSMTSLTAGFSTKTVNTVSLTVMKMGTGTISASLDGKAVPCAGIFCTVTGPEGSLVKLTAAPDSSGVFAGWSGLCTSATPDCTLTLKSNGVATATFKSGAGKLASSR